MLRLTCSVTVQTLHGLSSKPYWVASSGFRIARNTFFFPYVESSITDSASGDPQSEKNLETSRSNGSKSDFRDCRWALRFSPCNPKHRKTGTSLLDRLLGSWLGVVSLVACSWARLLGGCSPTSLLIDCSGSYILENSGYCDFGLFRACSLIYLA